MLNKNYIIIGLLILLIAFGAFYGIEKNELLTARELEAKRERTQLKNLRDSIQKVIVRKDSEILKALMESAEADMLAADAVKEAEKYKSKYDKIVFRVSRTDRERDSLVRAVLQH